MAWLTACARHMWVVGSGARLPAPDTPAHEFRRRAARRLAEASSLITDAGYTRFLEVRVQVSTFVFVIQVPDTFAHRYHRRTLGPLCDQPRAW